MANQINCYCENIDLPFNGISEGDIVSKVTKALEILELKDVEITIILTDNKYIQNINNEYRKKNKPTDVISFANRDNPFPLINEDTEDLGDIYISLQKALEQGEEFSITLKEEMNRLLVHGILHLIGFDHEKSKSEEKKMSSKEEEIFQQL